MELGIKTPAASSRTECDEASDSTSKPQNRTEVGKSPVPCLGGWFTRNQVVGSSRASLLALAERLGGLRRLFGKKDGVDVGKDATLRDGDAAQQLVQLLVVANGELDVAWDDAGLLGLGCEM